MNVFSKPLSQTDVQRTRLEKRHVLQKRELVSCFAFATKYSGVLFEKDENQS